MSIPYHRIVSPTPWELAQLFLSGPAIMARFPTVVNGTGRESCIFVCTDRNYDFASLHHKARNQTRRGLEDCPVEQVEFRYLAEHGHPLVIDTFLRQGRDRQSMSSQKWRRYCQVANQLSNFEAWIAFANGRPAAFLVAALVEDYYSILYQSSSNDCLTYNPNNALTFTITKLKLSCPEVACVSYGLKSLESTPGLEHFKLRMGYVKRAFKERIVLNPAVAAFSVLGGRRMIDLMSRKRPDIDVLRKAAAILCQKQQYE